MDLGCIYIVKFKNNDGYNMKLNELVKERMEKQNGLLSAADVVSKGFSRNLLSVYVREGLLVRLKQGLYSLPNSVEDDMYTLAVGYPHLVFSHESALFFEWAFGADVVYAFCDDSQEYESFCCTTGKMCLPLCETRNLRHGSNHL